ncbi:Aste57867_511 [Aphanomyces stellatus]|uniref:Aste57867_511 protein n=1 Tax=Aphanomyces stellatus TaxID=120398 RepID=A0A485K362_9STRA|nr:hypothetical protein As57867_000510 [Aphanomyces stellatus]VFT77736.1 Aste57867_511 [Aphanomyces stellatus]
MSVSSDRQYERLQTAHPPSPAKMLARADTSLRSCASQATPDDRSSVDVSFPSPRPPSPKSHRVHPCSKDEFDKLTDMVQGTDDVSMPEHRQSLVGNGPKARYSVHKYSNPDASDADDAAGRMDMTISEKVEAGGGLLYLAFTLVLSLYYLTMLTPAMANDLWWVGFNASGAQSYLIDTFNNQLNLHGNGTMDVQKNIYALPKDYSSYYTPIQVSPIYARAVLASMASDLRRIIPFLRALSSPENIQTQFCWIDFNHTWEVAHSDLRQQRCHGRYIKNAAVYWESLLRLIDWDMYMASAQTRFDLAMGNALKQSVAGREWLKSTPYAFQTLDAEVAYWQQAGLRMFQLQYSNLNSWGVDETISVTNAFGSSQSISIKRVGTQQRGALWTTAVLYWGTWNDFILVNAYGVSFVRSDAAHQRFTAPCSYTDYLANPSNYACDPCNPPWNPNPGDCTPDNEYILGLPALPCWLITHNYIGPFGTIDLYFESPPSSLLSFYTAFHDAITTLAQSNDDFFTALMDIPSLSADPVPPSWLLGQMVYFGGDPSCTKRVGFPHVQSSFAFDASCTDQSKNTILLHRFNILFAMAATNMTSSGSLKHLCSYCPTMYDACTTVVAASSKAWTLYNQYSSSASLLSNAAHTTISKIGVEIVQYALNETSQLYVLLQQPLLNQTSAGLDEWDFFGWIYIYDWAQASREVISFEGDFGVYPLISNTYAPQVIQAQGLEVPKSACQYLLVVSKVVTAVLIVVGVIITTYSCLLKCRIVGRNLLHFNRIAGSVWLGRPFMAVRGMTAIILLSSSPIEFGSRNGYTGFIFQPRTLIDTMVVSSEAMWITYVMNDVLLFMVGMGHLRYDRCR